MNDFLPYTKHQLEYALKIIQQESYKPIQPLEIVAYRTKEPIGFSDRFNGEKLELKVGDSWGELFDSAWFNFTGKVPTSASGKHIVLLLDVSGEMCVFDEQGIPVRGLTNAASEYDKRLGMPGKRVLNLLDNAQGGEIVNIWADAGCNDLFGRIQNNGTVQIASIAVANTQVRGLFYDFEVLFDSLKVLPENSPRAHEILNALHDVTHLIWNGFSPESVEKARLRLKPIINRKGGDPSLRISAVGHAHIDLGWLWPIRETHRKGVRTFATALANMEIYPDYVFAASQAQLFQWIKEDQPILYSKINQKINEKRIEPQGALWVECDTNVTGGESLIRQILYGKQFFRKEFNQDPNYIWLPDTFGYSGALPQIIKRSGMEYFSTQKLSWSLINTFPYHSFHWQGIDGSKVLVHMLPEETYNSPGAPRSIGKIEENYAQKGISEHALMVYGIGDGGGGPGEEHLERLSRIKNFAGLSPVEQRWTSDFFADLAKESESLPTWVGELYLERHQGTLTTSSKSKKYNRHLERRLRELEWISAVSNIESDSDYPTENLQTIWKEVLLYQFHDILPGSSIKRVYDESLARYAVLDQEVDKLIEDSTHSLLSEIDSRDFKEPLVVLNTLGWDRSTWVKHSNDWFFVILPSLGYTTIETEEQHSVPTGLIASDRILENDRISVQFSQNGSINSIFDKVAEREIIPNNELSNRLAVFQDPGDAWDIPMDYHSVEPEYMQIVQATGSIDGPKVTLKQEYRYGNSILIQEISLLSGSSVIEFDTKVQWVEPGTMLRAIFPNDIFADEASFEIQFGHVFRPTHTNTTWDLAKDEVPAHKWVDLSQRDYGVALINDCKYGHRIKGHTIELNLLRSVLYPGTRVVSEESYNPGEPYHAYTDQGSHQFRYAIYPHQGDLVAGEVIKTAYEFNFPVWGKSIPARIGSKPAARSFLSINKPNIIIETVKKPESEDGIIIRLYEAWRMQTKATLSIGIKFQSAELVNLIEEDGKKISLEGNSIQLEFTPFEIKTILLK